MLTFKNHNLSDENHNLSDEFYNFSDEIYNFCCSQRYAIVCFIFFVYLCSVLFRKRFGNDKRINSWNKNSSISFEKDCIIRSSAGGMGNPCRPAEANGSGKTTAALRIGDDNGTAHQWGADEWQRLGLLRGATDIHGLFGRSSRVGKILSHVDESRDIWSEP